MSDKSFSRIITGSGWLMRCSVCNHYVGEHHNKGCSIEGCECSNGFYDMTKDMRSENLRGYIESFGYNTKIALLVGKSYHIFDINEAENLSIFLRSLVDVAKMTAIPEQENES